jgi:hypothetical protein
MRGTWARKFLTFNYSNHHRSFLRNRFNRNGFNFYLVRAVISNGACMRSHQIRKSGEAIKGEALTLMKKYVRVGSSVRWLSSQSTVDSGSPMTVLGLLFFF